MYHNYTIFNIEKLFFRFNGLNLNVKNYNEKIHEIKKKLENCKLEIEEVKNWVI